MWDVYGAASGQLLATELDAATCVAIACDELTFKCRKCGDTGSVGVCQCQSAES
jgi:hypothetical protein